MKQFWILVAILLAATLATSAWAVDVTWTATSPSYVDDAGVWSATPVTGDNLYIAGVEAQITADHNFGTIGAGITPGSVFLGNGAGTSGYVTQTGGAVTMTAGSYLRVGNNINLGETDPTSLYDMSGGTFAAPSLTVIGYKGKGKLKLSGGDESTLGASFTGGNRLYVGDTAGTGTVEMIDYSKLSVPYFAIGRTSGNTGTVTMDDHAQFLVTATAGDSYLGSGGTGSMEMHDYTTTAFTIRTLFLGTNYSSVAGNGSLSLDGHANFSMTSTTGDANIGVGGTGSLNMVGDTTASITSRCLYVGTTSTTNGNGTLSLSGNAVLTNVNNQTSSTNKDSYTFIGNSLGNVAELNLSGHATMTSTNNNTDTWRGQFWVGRAYSTGTVNISGGTGYTEELRGAKLSTTQISNFGSYGDSGTGAQGTGYLNVHQYGQFETAGLFMADNGKGYLLIDGHGQVTVTGGKVTTLGGATMAVFSGELKDNALLHATGDMYLGDNASTGMLTLTTPTTTGDVVTLDVDGTFHIGNNGTDTDKSIGTLIINAGTVVDVGWNLYVGEGDNAKGTVTMNGGKLTTVAWLNVGRTGGGTNGVEGLLTMNGESEAHAGGTIFAGNAYSGNLVTAGKGTITLNDNAKLLTDTDICIAYGGVGELNVGDGTAPVGTDLGAVATATTYIRLGTANTCSEATLNVNVGGTVETPYITTEMGASAVINLDGGLLKVMADDTPTTPFIKNTAGIASFAINVLDDGARIDTNGHNATIDEALVEDGLSTGGGLTKLGEGILTLSKACSYKGDTSVQAGSLAVNGSITSDVLVDSGAALMGNGTVTGNVTAVAGSSVAAGNSIGTLTVTGDLTLGGTLDVEYDGDTSTIDMLAVSGELDLTGGTLSFSNWGTAPLADGAYVFATYGTLTGAPVTEVGLEPGWFVDYAYDYNGGNDNSIALIAVPEPSILALMVGLAMAMAGCRVRR